MSNNETIIASFEGVLTDQLPGWEFHASKPEGGMTYNEFEGYYPDKGGKLYSSIIKLNKSPEVPAYYRIKFAAEAPETAYQGVDFLDADGNPLADNYDVIYAGEKRAYNRVVYAVAKAESIRVFFQSKTGVKAWELIVETATPEDAANYCDTLYATLPLLDFTAPKDGMDLLPKTADALTSGKSWKVLMLGDSIVQDTFHSQFHALLKREFPESNFQFDLSVRGSTGCWFYHEPDQLKSYVLDHQPDLLMVGGISNNREDYDPSGTEAMEIVAREANAQLGCEVVIMSGTLSVDTREYDPEHPNTPLPIQAWRYEKDEQVQRSFDKASLTEMTQRLNIPLWDLQTPSYKWLYASGKPHEWFSRDYVHSGERGKQIIGRALFEYFKTAWLFSSK